jgi:hypothetical protein
MSRLVWLVLGLLGGIVIARNAEPMSGPVTGAVVLGMLAGCGVCWWAAYRGKSGAVASAVAAAMAVAHAEAEATADARAQAIAQQAVTVYLGQHAPHDPATAAALSRPGPAAVWGTTEGEAEPPRAAPRALPATSALWLPEGVRSVPAAS